MAPPPPPSFSLEILERVEYRLECGPELLIARLSALRRERHERPAGAGLKKKSCFMSLPICRIPTFAICPTLNSKKRW